MQLKWLKNVTQYIQSFINLQALSGIVLLLCSLAALIISNTIYSDSFLNFFNTRITFSVNNIVFDKSLAVWINEGLMAVFFFVTGLEIKREILFGELSSRKKLLLPIIAACGGAIVPAVIYYILNYNTAGAGGWGIPMATDIAFVFALVVLLNKRVPHSLKIFVLAFAIIDDLIAILVIALFYSHELNVEALMYASIILIIMGGFNLSNIYKTPLFLILGILFWMAFVKSGIHATVAGVIMAFMMPFGVRLPKKEFLPEANTILKRLNKIYTDTNNDQIEEQTQLNINKLEVFCKRTQSPMHRFEQKLHPFSSFFVVPVFALANAGIRLEGLTPDSVIHPVSIGVILGLIFGKQIGIYGSVWIFTKLKITELPTKARFIDIYGASCLAGMGFTMSLFITLLAFTDDVYINHAKLGIVVGSLIAALSGVIVFFIFPFPQSKKPA